MHVSVAKCSPSPFSPPPKRGSIDPVSQTNLIPECLWPRCSFGRKLGPRAQGFSMRRVVRDYVATSISRARPQLEQYIARHLKYSEPFPFVLTEPVASILQIRRVKITPRFRADYPPLDIVATMHLSMTARTRKRVVELGTRSFDIDVELDALGSVQSDG
jgi:hypothetical protein